MAAASIAGMPYPPGNSGNVLPELTREQRRKGGLARAEQRRKQLREQRERADEAFMQVVREQAAPIAAALVEEILDNPLGHANRVPAIREANLRLLGRPETTGTVARDPDKPIRIVVESISSRRREQLADVKADDAEVEDVTDA
jgi:hypothetical protein